VRCATGATVVEFGAEGVMDPSSHFKN